MGRNKVESINILLVDDFNEWRRTVRLMLEVVSGFRVIDEASDGLEAIEKAAQLQPDVVLLDVGLPLLDGIESARTIRLASPGSRIIFLSMLDDDDIRRASFAAGAEAYVLKSKAAGELRYAIEAVMCCEHPVFPPNSFPLDHWGEDTDFPLTVFPDSGNSF